MSGQTSPGASPSSAGGGDGAPPRVCVVVVTHERLALLRECLGALRAQTRPPDATLVVDNASADGTVEALRAEFSEVQVLALAENTGGAGGFHAGLRRAHAQGFDWMWLMDDDTVPEPTALAELLAGARAAGGDEPPLVLASRVEWRDGSLHPMNLPLPRVEDPHALVDLARHGLLPIRSASFVSVLVHRRALDRYGLPRAGFFIYSDDLEFTARVLRRERGFLVGASVAEHRTRSAHQPYETGPRFYYDVRNTLYMLRGSSWSPAEKRRLARHLVHNVREHLRRERFGREALATVGRGLRDGLLRPVPGERDDARPASQAALGGAARPR